MKFQFIDNNTGADIEASSDFGFASAPDIGHVIHDADLKAYFGTFAVVQKVETKDGVLRVFVDGSEEIFNSGEAAN